MANGFNGGAGQSVPEMTPAVVEGISKRYIELFEHVTGQSFEGSARTVEEMEKNILSAL